MHITKFNEIHKIIQDGKYKYIGLETKEGKTIIAYNGLAKDLDKRIKEIETRLKSPAFHDGEYIIVLKNTQFKNVQPDKITIAKGAISKGMTESPTSMQQSPEVLTWDEAKKMYQANAELTAQVTLLTKELDRAKEVIEENDEYIKQLEGDLDKYEKDGHATETSPVEKPLLSEPAKPAWITAISEITPAVKSVLEVILENKNNQNNALKQQAESIKGLAEEIRNLKTSGRGEDVRGGGDQGGDPGDNNLSEDENMMLDYLDSLRQQNPEAYKNTIQQIKEAYGTGTDQ